MTAKSDPAPGPLVLTINGGSSSIRFGLYRGSVPPLLELSGKIERIGLPGCSLSFHDRGGSFHGSHSVAAGNHAAAAQHLRDWLSRHAGAGEIAAIGHRLVHGGAKLHEPQRLTAEVVDELRRIRDYAPEHLPAEIAMIELFSARMPGIPQFACFDTAFHRGMPRVAKMLAIPRRYQVAGIERYGFHGLSYTYLMEELARVAGREAARGRVVLAHLGNGASLAAVCGGRSIDTSMGFTPAAGLPMSTRAGDLDPGLAAYFARSENMTAEQFQRMINHESGLLGISETSPDVRDLLEKESTDVRAAEAVALFCYQARKWIGAYAAALGGLDTLVFSGGIGENSAVIRSRICEGLQFLGINLDEARNAAGEPVVTIARSPVCVRVMRTDEDVIIARSVFHLLSTSPSIHSGPRP
jgi:acetate kinase